MPEISKFFGIIIKMFAKDHNPPHLHAEYGNYKAVFNIYSGEKICGKFPVKKEALVKAWIVIHQEELMKNWDNLTIGKGFKKIKPLS